MRWAETKLPETFVGRIEIHFAPGGGVGNLNVVWSVTEKSAKDSTVK